MLAIFWEDGPDAINYFKELTIQVRVQDAWYSRFLEECRIGQLSEENYNFLMGFPTLHAGSWMLNENNEGQVTCGHADCQKLPATWRLMALDGSSWEKMQDMECDFCKQERKRRTRLIEPSDPRLFKEPFLSAPYVHRNNEPKYHAMLLRAVELAKRSSEGLVAIAVCG